MAAPAKILVVGLGLGGLSCAISCKQAGFEVEILERAPQISNVRSYLHFLDSARSLLHY